jgi:hypothetical protein
MDESVCPSGQSCIFLLKTGMFMSDMYCVLSSPRSGWCFLLFSYGTLFEMYENYVSPSYGNRVDWASSKFYILSIRLVKKHQNATNHNSFY